MNHEHFKRLKNFSYREVEDHYKSKGLTEIKCALEIAKLKPDLFEKLQIVRDVINCPIHINSLTDGIHSAGSFHYQGVAVDWRPGDVKIHPNKIFQACLTVGFTGFGWYPEWRWPGFHTDIGERKEIKVWQKVDGDYKPLIEAV